MLFMVYTSSDLQNVVICMGSMFAKGGGSANHIVPFGKFHRIGGAQPETFPSFKYDVPEEVGGNRKCFDSPIRK